MGSDGGPISLIRADYDRTVKPALVETYSFEYVFRLFLILCSTKPSLIKSLSAKEIDVLEPTFLSGMKACISALNEEKGLSMDASLVDQYAAFATSTLLRYLKGGMGPSPVSVAGQVAKALEEKLYSDGVLDPRIDVTNVFLEKRA
jgi:hypothetical protein